MTFRLRSADAATGIRCVALDAVGTVIFAEPSVANAYAEIGRQFGSRSEVAEVRCRLAQAMRRAEDLSISRFGEPGRTDEATERLFWEQVVTEVLSDVTDRAGCFESLFEHFARPESWRCFADVGPTITELQRRGYRVVLASNFDARLNSVCDGLADLREMTSRVISSRIGYRKTHPGFYPELVRLSECSPREVLMVGDDLENDVASAERSGLSAVWLNRKGELSPGANQIGSLTDLLELLP